MKKFLLLVVAVIALVGCNNSFGTDCLHHTRWMKSICEVDGKRYECDIIICERDMRTLLEGETPDNFKEVIKGVK